MVKPFQKSYFSFYLLVIIRFIFYNLSEHFPTRLQPLKCVLTNHIDSFPNVNNLVLSDKFVYINNDTSVIHTNHIFLIIKSAKILLVKVKSVIDSLCQLLRDLDPAAEIPRPVVSFVTFPVGLSGLGHDQKFVNINISEHILFLLLVYHHLVMIEMIRIT